MQIISLRIYRKLYFIFYKLFLFYFILQINFLKAQNINEANYLNKYIASVNLSELVRTGVFDIELQKILTKTFSAGLQGILYDFANSFSETIQVGAVAAYKLTEDNIYSNGLSIVPSFRFSYLKAKGAITKAKPIGTVEAIIRYSKFWYITNNHSTDIFLQFDAGIGNKFISIDKAQRNSLSILFRSCYPILKLRLGVGL